MPEEFSLEDQFGEQPVKTYTMYGGRVVLKYNDTDHLYFIEDSAGIREITNVTSFLGIIDKSHALVNWAVRLAIQSLEQNMGIREDISIYHFSKEHLQGMLEEARNAHRKAKNKAADLGHIAHKWLEDYGYDRSMGIPPIRPKPENTIAKTCVSNALAWFIKHDVRFLECERKVLSIEDGYAGTIDVIAMVDGLLTLIDYKSSNGVYDQYRFQTAAYQKAYEEETGRKIEQRILLRLGKEDGVFEPHVFKGRDEYEMDYMAAKAALILYERVQELRYTAREEKAKEKERKKKMPYGTRAA